MVQNHHSGSMVNKAQSIQHNHTMEQMILYILRSMIHLILVSLKKIVLHSTLHSGLDMTNMKLKHVVTQVKKYFYVLSMNQVIPI